MNKYLGNFQIIRPKFEVEQEKVLDWIAAAHQRVKGEKSTFSTKELLARIQKGVNKIKKRGIHTVDFSHFNWEAMEIYTLDENSPGKRAKERTLWFDREVFSLFDQFYPENCPLPSHLLHVTCTGYSAPSGAQKIVSKRKASTAVIHVYHMGCYGSFPALRIAQGLTSDTDVVHTEICSLHLDPLTCEIEQFIIQSLFADGFIKYSLSSQAKELEILSLHEEIIPDTTHCMAWHSADFGMKMTLNKEVPFLIRKALPQLLDTLAKKANMPLPDLIETAFFAIHPGGPKIVEQISELLNLNPWQISQSREIMENCGNMSSATLPHIWQKMASSSLVPPEALIVSLAFGPGLTFCSGLFKKVN
jgi:predicted naringenin-chalcone synthase